MMAQARSQPAVRRGRGRPRTVNADVKLTVSVPQDVFCQMEEAVRLQQTSRSEFIRLAVSVALSDIHIRADGRQTELPLGGRDDVVTP